MGDSNRRIFALSNELKLMLYCSKPDLNEDNHKAIASLIAGNIDWNLFVHWNLYHQVYPQVCLYFTKHQCNGVPRQVQYTLRQASKINEAKTLQMVLELSEILNTLKQNSIQAVVLKGFPMAYNFYHSVSLRPSADIDIMVRREDLDASKKIVERLGYNLILTSEAKRTEFQIWMEAHHNLDFWHEDKQIVLELHWRLGSHGIDIPQALVDGCLTNMQFAGKTVTVLSNEVLLLYLISHGAGHVWCQFRWLRDVDAVIRKGDFSWEHLYQLADSLEARHFLHQALILTSELLETPLPEHIEQLISKDFRARELALQAFNILATKGYHQNLPLLSWLFFRDRRYRFCLLNSWRKRLEYFSSQSMFCLKVIMKGILRRVMGTQKR
jgi:hypothetical protein